MNRPFAVIESIASFLPEKRLTNQTLSTMVETSDEWIVSRTGIKERRIADDEEFTSTLGARAAQKLLKQTKISPLEIELIIVTTMTPDFLCPSTAALIQAEIGAKQAAVFDMEAACSGFIYGLSISKAFIESGLYSSILLISAEKNSAFVDYTDRGTCILFGDGASASLIRNGGKGLRIENCHLGADGTLADLLHIPAGGCQLPCSSHDETLHTLKMNGREVFKHAVREMTASSHICLDKAGITPSHIRWFVPHQANLRIMEAVADRLQIPFDRVAVTIDQFANTSSATIPIALDLLLQEEKIQSNDYLLLAAVGGGLTWGSTLLHAT